MPRLDTLTRRGALIILVMSLILLFFPLSGEGQNLIACYPLDSSPNDTSGTYGPMTLINTPFQDGGIYCNGIYIYSGDPNHCHAVTPEITGLSFQAFSISARFKVMEPYTNGRPVFVGGNSYRWMAFFLESDSTVALAYNYSILRSNVRYSRNTWHEAMITYDSSFGVGKFYLDDFLVDSVQFQLAHGNDRFVGITHFGYSNAVFKGILRDLRIYSGIIVPTTVEESRSEKVTGYKLMQNYPNPFNPTTTIKYDLPKGSRVSLKLFNIFGQEVATLVNEEQKAGYKSVEWNATTMATGVYFYRLDAGELYEREEVVVAEMSAKVSYP